MSFFSGARARAGGGLDELLLCLLGLADEALESLASCFLTGALPELRVTFGDFAVAELAPAVLTVFAGRLVFTVTFFLIDAVVPFCTLVRTGALRSCFLPVPVPGEADDLSIAAGLNSGEQGEALLALASRRTPTAFTINFADAADAVFCPSIPDDADRFESVAFFESVLGLDNLVFTIFAGVADDWRFTTSIAFLMVAMGDRLRSGMAEAASMNALEAAVEDVRAGVGEST